MGQMLIRDIDDTLKQRLRERAAANGRSMNAEVCQILSTTLDPALRQQRNAEVMEKLAAFRAKLVGREHTPAEELVRESRDVDAR